MNSYYPDNFLLTQATLGFLWVVVLFIFCFLGIHLLKLAQMGWAQTKTPPKEEEPPKAPPKKEKQTPKNGAPVYYIVEKRKKPPKSYGEPREITFK